MNKTFRNNKNRDAIKHNKYFFLICKEVKEFGMFGISQLPLQERDADLHEIFFYSLHYVRLSSFPFPLLEAVLI